MSDTVETVKVTIDGQELTVPKGTTILDAAHEAGIHIPTICYHRATTPEGICRMCVVEIEGWRQLQPACKAQCSDGMTIHTRSERVDRARKTILELLASTVDLSEAPEIQAMISEYGADVNRFADGERRQRPFLDDNPFYVRDYDKCVLCWRCIQVCAEDAQFIFALTLSGRGFESRVTTFYDEPMPCTTCVFCGQCVGICPTNALKPKVEWAVEQNMPPEKIREVTSAQALPPRKRTDPTRGGCRWS